MMIKTTGFQPNLDPVVTDKASIIDCTNLVPTNNGMKSVQQGEKAVNNVVPDTVIAGFSQTLLDATARVFACSLSRIYELLAGNWVDVSKTGGYATATNGTWRMCQFGNVTIAVNGTDATQASSVTGTFADLAGSPPKARICETTQGFVLLFHTNDGIETLPDGWWSSGLYDYTQWQPSTQTQSANGRLIDTPGAIVGAKQMANAIMAYKQNSMYLGEYVGGDVIWSWRQISDNTGAYVHEAIVNVEGAHYFIGNNGLFRYDGSRLEPIGTLEVKEWIRGRINLDLVDKIRGFYDQKNSLIYWYYPSNSSSGDCDEALVFHTITGQFGKVTRGIKSIVNLTLPNLTWGELGALYPTWGSWPSTVQWNSPIFYGAGVGHSYFGTDNFLYKADSGASLDSALVTGDFGDDSTHSVLNRVRMRFLKKPETASMKHQYKSGVADTLKDGVTVSMSDDKFDLTKSARFHKATFNFTGITEVSSVDFNLTASGSR